MKSQACVMFVANQRGCLIGGLGLARARFVESKVSTRTLRYGLYLGALYGGPQLSREYQIPHGNNKKLTAKPARQGFGESNRTDNATTRHRLRTNCLREPGKEVIEPKSDELIFFDCQGTSCRK